MIKAAVKAIAKRKWVARPSAVVGVPTGIERRNSMLTPIFYY
jgi:hypothetical protein